MKVRFRPFFLFELKNGKVKSQFKLICLKNQFFPKCAKTSNFFIHKLLLILVKIDF